MQMASYMVVYQKTSLNNSDKIHHKDTSIMTMELK